MTTYQFVRYEEIKPGEVVVVTLDRPEKLNAISTAMASELADAFHRFDRSDARVAIVRGEGRAFTAGMDVMENVAAGRSTMQAPDLGGSYNPFWPGQMLDADDFDTPRLMPGQVRRLKKPVIAAVHGYAFGGGFIMAMAADLCVAAESTLFELSEVSRGMAAGWDMGYLHRFPRHVSMEIALGLRMSGRRAYDLGLVNRLVADEDLLASALELARELCALPESAVLANRELVDSLIPVVPERVAARSETLRRAVADSPESVAAFHRFAESHRN